MERVDGMLNRADAAAELEVVRYAACDRPLAHLQCSRRRSPFDRE